MDPQRPQAGRQDGFLSGSDDSLPTLPSLEHLRKQAKHLLAACRQGDPAALERVQKWFPDLNAEALKLTHAQLVVAREHGSPSWAALRQAVLTALVERLGQPHWSDWRTAKAAAQALEREGDAGLMAVLEGLSHPDPRVRRGAADYMDHHADDRCVAKLLDLALHDPVPYVRRYAMHAMSCQRCKPSPLTTSVGVDIGRAVLEDTSPRVRWHSVALADTAHVIRVAREDPSPRVRQRAWAALGERRGDAMALQALQQALDDPDQNVRRVAHRGMRRLSPEYRRLADQRAREASLAQHAAQHAARGAAGTATA